MSKKLQVMINCDTPEMRDAVLDLFISLKRDLHRALGMILENKGQKSDPKIVVNNNLITITQKSEIKKNIFITQDGENVQLVNYTAVPIHGLYFELKDGNIFTFVKRPSGIDQAVGRYDDLETAARDVNSNNVVLAVEAIVAEDTQKKSEPEQLEPSVDVVEEVNQ